MPMTEVRMARKSDSAGIAHLMKEGYDPQALSITIYGCDGIARYLDAQLSLSPALIDARYVVAEQHGGITGFVEFKFVGNSVFLNYICTSLAKRGAGVAGLMLHEGTRLIRAREHSIMYLDVFRDNTSALEWYRKLGFQSAMRTAWWKIPLRRSSAKPGRISGHAQAEACHAAFGFSTVTITTSQRSYPIGKLGSRWFKTDQPCLLDDDEAMASLAALDPGRSLLGLLPSDYPCEHIEDAERLHLAERMSIDIDVLLRAVAVRRPPQ